MENFCRVCASSNVSLMDIYSKFGPDERSPADMLIECVDCNVRLDDPFPKKICLSCVVVTQKAFIFKRRYEQSHKHFCQLLNRNNICDNLPERVCEEPAVQQIEFEENLEENNNGVAENANGNVVLEKANGNGAAEEDNGNGAAEEDNGNDDEIMKSLKLEEEEIQLQETDAEIWEIKPRISEMFLANEASFTESNTNGIINTNDEMIDLKSEKIQFCTTCGEVFPNHTQLLLHSLKHLEVGENKCPYCPKNFKFRTGLKTHIVNHSEDVPFKCAHCSKVFFHENRMIKHLRMHTGKRPFQCPQCVQSFSHSYSLDKHVRSHKPKRRYKCNDCESSFKSKDKLDRHTQIHSKDRPFQCPHCRKGFKVKKQLQNHIATHSNERQYKCSNCPKQFILLENLKQHNRFHCNTSNQTNNGKSHSLRTRRSTRGNSKQSSTNLSTT